MDIPVLPTKESQSRARVRTSTPSQASTPSPASPPSQPSQQSQASRLAGSPKAAAAMSPPESTGAQSRFSGIPVEVLLNITAHLNTKDLGAMRLTCRQIEDQLFNSFVAEFFTKKQFMITEDSLQALIDIANHGRLSGHLTHVMIGLDFFNSPGCPRQPPTGLARQSYAYQDGWMAQSTLLSTGRHREMLTEAFGALKNLKTVCVRSYNSPMRTRDGPRRQWRSYGATRVLEQTGISISDDTGNSHQQLFADVFAAVVYSLGRAEARPETIEVLRRSGPGLRDLAFHLPGYVMAASAPVLRNLKTLHLALSVADGSLIIDETARTRMLRAFVAELHSLERLRLNFDLSSSPAIESFLEWLAHPPGPVAQSHRVDSLGQTVPAVADAISLPHLVELELGMAQVNRALLLRLVRKFAPTLRRLGLWRLTLLHGNSSGYPREPSAAPAEGTRVNLWARFFDELRRVPGLDLHHVLVHLVSQTAFNKHAHVSFKRREGDKQPAVRYGGSVDDISTREYTGIDWKHFLEELAPETMVAYPSDDEDEEDDEDDLDEYDDDLLGEDDDDFSDVDDIGFPNPMEDLHYMEFLAQEHADAHGHPPFFGSPEISIDDLSEIDDEILDQMSALPQFFFMGGGGPPPPPP